MRTPVLPNYLNRLVSQSKSNCRAPGGDAQAACAAGVVGKIACVAGAGRQPKAWMVLAGELKHRRDENR